MYCTPSHCIMIAVCSFAGISQTFHLLILPLLSPVCSVLCSVNLKLTISYKSQNTISTNTLLVFILSSHCRPFEDHITSWLCTALNYNPEKRGGRLNTVEDAPCLNYMQQILSTKVSLPYQLYIQ